jgi:uncharacterized protein YgiB involved in biofilm formation
MHASRPRKSSASVRLAFMGAAAATVLVTPGCGEDVQRNRYGSQAECVADYSDAQCRPDYPVGGGYRPGMSTGYYGPWYRSNAAARGAEDPGPGRYFRGGGMGFSSGSTSRAPSVETGTRGGFGGHGVSARG